MTAKLEQVAPGGVPRRTPVATDVEPSRPVVVWAGLGAVLVAVILWTWLRWVTSSDFRATPHGSDDFGGWHAFAIQGVQVLLFGSGVWLVWRYLVRTLLRERRLSFDGMLIISGALAAFYEPVGSMFNVGLVYNTHLFNFGSWAQFIPGWRTPNVGTLVIPVFFVFGMYQWFVAGFVFLGCGILRRLRARFPAKSNLWLFSVLFGICFLIDFAFEFVILRTEIYAYPAIPQDLSLWFGKPYQYPVHSAFLGASVLVSLTAFRYFRDDQGLSIAQRGVNRLALPRRARTLVSTLAVIGFSHVCVVLGWFVPFNLAVTLQAETGPSLPSYMRDGVCGTGTAYACPSEFVPLPGPDSLHVGPDDPRLPPQVRSRQGVDP